MMIKVLHYDAFTDTPGMGNPAGIVLNADNLSEEQMQSVAAAAGYNETAFVLSSDKADIRLRFFTPGHEMDLCGHATVASVFMMKEHGILKTDEILLETLHPEADMHGRHFSSPLSGTVEDPVTGTASGIMGAYYQKHILDSGNRKKSIIVEQGQDIGKDGIIKVELPTKKEDAVKIYGTAVFVKEFFVREQST